MTPKAYQKVIETCWALAEQGLGGLTVDQIVQHTGYVLEDIQALFPTQKHIILALLADLRQKVEAEAPLTGKEDSLDEGVLSADDQFFDGVLHYFDEAQPYKKAIKKLSQEIMWNPFLLLGVMPGFQDFSNALSRHYYPVPENTSCLKGEGQQKLQQWGHQVLLLRVFYVWLEDETEDLSQTMAALDQGMKQCQSVMSVCR